MSTRLAQRLSRLLNLVPYFVANPGISAADAAAELGVTPKQLLTDLRQLWMCGLPGYGPGDLIDLLFSEESIEVSFTAGIDRPMRLTSIEATVLLMALRSIADMPGMVDPTAAQGAMAKIETAAGVAAARNRPAGSVVTEEVPVEDPSAATVRAALGAGHALRLVYYSASRDAVSDRVVDPIRILAIDEHSYLQAWCRQAEAVRLFRIDRVYEATELDEPATPPADARRDDHALDLFSDDPALPLARLRIAPTATWMLDLYPMTPVEQGFDGTVEATMRFASVEWMARLILGFGSSVTVGEPPELVEAVQSRARSALTAYAELERIEPRDTSGSIENT